jgi:hypothetical protein
VKSDFDLEDFAVQTHSLTSDFVFLTPCTCIIPQVRVFVKRFFEDFCSTFAWLGFCFPRLLTLLIIPHLREIASGNVAQTSAPKIVETAY